MSEQFFIREFAEHDLNGLRQAFYSRVIPVYQESDEALFLEYLSDCNDSIFVSITDAKDHFIGAFDCYPLDDTLLISMYLLPSYQGRGIGTKALTLFIAYIKKNYSFQYLEALINNMNLASLKLVQKCHFLLSDNNEYAQTWKYRLK
eukprot:GHVU01079040.1.p1 GENE.GHVU01079040.1~~GHVU01079040.1.p1  ORF type:complete len:147 (-),score=8.73 GHVU01079040.1:104-544(-)